MSVATSVRKDGQGPSTDWRTMKSHRRTFLARTGATAAGLLIAPSLRPFRIFSMGRTRSGVSLTKVALTPADSYDRTVVKQRVQHLFESLGGIGDILHSGQKVAIKLNLTGGSSSANSPKLNGRPITEAMWPHPEIVRAVGELILDCGVSANSIYLVEALWDDGAFNNFGYQEVQAYLGAQKTDLNKKAPYTAFVQLPVGPNKHFYDSFTVNQILADVDVYVSIPKMKEHAEAGVTAALKNQVGMVPKDLYTLPTDSGRRGALHGQGGPSSTHLPRSVSDLNLARPVHLTVIDGIRNARGGEGVWNPMFQVAEDHVLIAGKDPVAADSVAAYLMGHDPEAPTIALPGGGQCDSHLHLLHLSGAGTNQMAEIEPVGDGAGLITAVGPATAHSLPQGYVLEQNYPNPFNPTTTISYQLPVATQMRLSVHDALGREIGVLAEGLKPAGTHKVELDARILGKPASGVASGAYFIRMTAGDFVQTRRMALIR
jgi:uncharacterized protein (DUF362 family)